MLVVKVIAVIYNVIWPKRQKHYLCRSSIVGSRCAVAALYGFLFNGFLPSFDFYGREFVTFCGRALELNSMLIKPDQLMYQEDLRNKYEEMKEKLAPFVGFVSNFDILF